MPIIEDAVKRAQISVVLSVIVVLASFCAAVFWFLSAAVEIPDSIDTIVAALQHSSRWSARAAFSAGVAAVCGIALLVIEWWGSYHWPFAWPKRR